MSTNLAFWSVSGLAATMVLLLSGCPSGDGADPAPGECLQAGKTHPLGSTFPADDGCNSCLCTTDGASCTEIACEPKPTACVRGGCSGQLCMEEGEAIGTTCEFREEYACYARAKCERQSDGKCGHTPSKQLDACLASTGALCAYGSEWKRVGSSFPSSDGCNTCTCTETGVSCTERACIPEQPKPCVRGGCSGQLCAEEALVSTCEFKPEYACYQQATCERQKNGQCGFTPTNELVQCLSTHGTCIMDGRTFKTGVTFASADGCNSCVCTGDGAICTERACPL